MFASKIEVASTISLGNKEGEQNKASLSVTLQSDKPVMVSASRFWMANLEYALGRSRSSPPQEKIKWMPFRDEDACMAGAFSDDPDHEVVVGKSDKFRCLQPGETWTITSERIPDMDDDPGCSLAITLRYRSQVQISNGGIGVRLKTIRTLKSHSVGSLLVAA